jgi:hypothetical protein
MGSPALDVPVRDRKQAALDMAISSLESVRDFSHEEKCVNYANRQLARIAEILGEAR